MVVASWRQEKNCISNVLFYKNAIAKALVLFLLRCMHTLYHNKIVAICCHCLLNINFLPRVLCSAFSWTWYLDAAINYCKKFHRRCVFGVQEIFRRAIGCVKLRGIKKSERCFCYNCNCNNSKKFDFKMYNKHRTNKHAQSPKLIAQEAAQLSFAACVGTKRWWICAVTTNNAMEQTTNLEICVWAEAQLHHMNSKFETISKNIQKIIWFFCHARCLGAWKLSWCLDIWGAHGKKYLVYRVHFFEVSLRSQFFFKSSSHVQRENSWVDRGGRDTTMMLFYHCML